MLLVSTEVQRILGTCASNCFRLGDLEARMTRLPLSKFNAGRSNGGGGRNGPGDLPWGGLGDGCEEASYEGGGSEGIGAGFKSTMIKIGRTAADVSLVGRRRDLVDVVVGD